MSESDRDGLKRRREASGSENPIVLGGRTPPHALSLEEVMDFSGPGHSEDFAKMALAHEIALNDDFKVGEEEPEPESLGGRVASTMHDVFWDLFRTAITQEPPDHEPVLALISELREAFLDLTLPHQAKLRGEMESLFDMDQLKQETEQGAVDYGALSLNALAMMGRLCSPARDEAIAALRTQSDLVLRFRGIMEVVQLMRKDMSNFAIAAVRPVVKEHSVAYEREKFDSAIADRPDALRHTTEWLRRAFLAKEGEAPAAKATSSTAVLRKTRVRDIATEAYLQLLEWPENRPFPETLLVDERRLLDLRDGMMRLTIVTAAVLSTASASPSLPTTFPSTLKEKLMPLLLGVRQRTLSSKLTPLTEVCLASVAEAGTELSSESMSALRSTLLQLLQPQHSVRKIIHTRWRGFLESLLARQGGGEGAVEFPGGLGVVKPELLSLSQAFLRLVAHNRAVHAPRYDAIIAELLPPEA